MASQGKSIVENDEEFFWGIKESNSTPSLSQMSTPRRPHRVLSAESLLLRTSALQPIIASRGARSRDLDQQSRWSRSVYDEDAASPVIVTHFPQPARTHVHRLDDNYKTDAVVPAVVYLQARPRPPDTPPPVVRQDARILDYDYYWLKPSLCYIFVKILEMLLCIAIITLSRVGEDYLDLDLIETLFGVIGLAVSGISLMILWIKGHPFPGDCLHTTIMLCYGIVIPLLLCGGILVLVQPDLNNGYVPALATLFLTAMVIFILDVVVLAAAVLSCGGGCAEYLYSRPRTAAIYPHGSHGHRRRARYDDDYYDDDDRYPRRGKAGWYFRRDRSRSPPPGRELRYPGDSRYPGESSYPVDRELYPDQSHPAYLAARPQMNTPNRSWTSHTVPGQY